MPPAPKTKTSQPLAMVDKVTEFCLDLGAESYSIKVAYFASLMRDPENGELDTLSMNPNVFAMVLRLRRLLILGVENWIL